MDYQKEMESIQQKYGLACAKLGDLVFKTEQMEKDVHNTKVEIQKLNLEALSLQKKYQESLPKAEPVTSLAPVPDQPA